MCSISVVPRPEPERGAVAWPLSTRRNFSMGSPPDDADFRRAVAGVAPLAESRRIELRPDPPPPPPPRQSERDERAALAESLAGPVSLDDAIDSGEELSFLREGLSRQVLR